jgi:predicted amidohydrolase YtcJ
MTIAQPAHLLLTGGAVRTMDAVRSQAEAVAVRDGRISFVGLARDAREHVGPRTRVVDLRGRTLLPAFQDAHVHPALAGINLALCPLHDVPRNLPAYQAAIREAVGRQKGAWILGNGWYMSVFPGGTPSRHDLDAVTDGRPAFFSNRDEHGAWANSAALELAGITRDTPDPADGRIEREPDGTPQGTLHEGAMELVRRLIPQPSTEELADGIVLAQQFLHSLGISAWQDAWVEPKGVAAYRLLAEQNRITGRAIANLWWDRERGAEQIEDLVERRAQGTLGRLRADTVKIMVDGVAENYTAAMVQPYLDADGHATSNAGISFVEPQALKHHVTRLDALGFQVHFHALGDRAVREALDAVEAARRANGPSDTRPHLAHLQFVHPHDVPRFRGLGAAANFQPYWACDDDQMLELTKPFVSADTYASQYPIRTLHRSGAMVVGGSDWSVSTPNVMAEIEVAVTHRSPEDRGRNVFLPDERIDLPEALAMFTVGSAWVNHLERETGTIEVGKAADLAVLDRDIFAPDAGHLGDVRVLLTTVAGVAVHEDPELEG